MPFVVPAVMPPAPRDTSAPAKIRASTMASYLLRDRHTFATARRALVQMWPIASVTSAAFTTIVLAPFNLLPTSNGKLRITVRGTDIELRVFAYVAGTIVIIPIVGTAQSITTLAGCTPGAFDFLGIEIRRTSASGVLEGAWVCDANLVAGELP